VNKLERTAIEAVAKRFSAICEDGRDSSDACITVAGKRVAVDIATVKRPRARQGEASKLHLRFDKVAIRLMQRLQAAVGETAPNGVTVLLTVTAPIRLAAKTAEALEERIQALLARGSPGRDDKGTIHGNSIRMRLVRHSIEQGPKMIGFVHNPDSDALLLLDLTGDLIELISAATGRRPAGPVKDRWLVLAGAIESSYLPAYRYICSELPGAAGFQKILWASGDGQVEALAG
jgi:hypothetical protein